MPAERAWIWLAGCRAVGCWLCRQVVLWKEIVNLREPAASGLQSYARAPEPAALASLQQFEDALCSLQEVPISPTEYHSCEQSASMGQLAERLHSKRA